MQKPSVGRIVHYVCNLDGRHKAAIIIRVWSDQCVNLTIFAEDGLEFKTSVLHDLPNEQGGTRGTWHWPEAVSF